MITLFEHPLSPYAQKVKIALMEKGVEFRTELPDLLSGTGGPEFNAANPRREVPALVDGDLKVFDSTIILEYIEDKWPKPPLLPASPAERARVRMLEELCDTHYEAITWGLAEIRYFKRATGDLAERMIARGGTQIAGVNAYLERVLGSRAYFNGDAFGWGDLSVVVAVNSGAFAGFPPAEGSALAGWLARVQQRPSVEKVLAQGIESLSVFEMLPQLIASGQFVREYRDHRLEWMLRSGGTEIVLDGMMKKNIRFSVDLT